MTILAPFICFFIRSHTAHLGRERGAYPRPPLPFGKTNTARPPPVLLVCDNIFVEGETECEAFKGHAPSEPAVHVHSRSSCINKAKKDIEWHRHLFFA